MVQHNWDQNGEKYRSGRLLFTRVTCLRCGDDDTILYSDYVSFQDAMEKTPLTITCEVNALLTIDFQAQITDN